MLSQHEAWHHGVPCGQVTKVGILSEQKRGVGRINQV